MFLAFVYNNENEIVALYGKLTNKKQGHRLIDRSYGVAMRRRFVKV